MILGLSYSRFEGLTTPWSWLDRLLCRMFGHPPRRYFFTGDKQACARCCKWQP